MALSCKRPICERYSTAITIGSALHRPACFLGGTKIKIVNAMGGKERLDAKTGGKWRIFGKTGSGFSHIRERHEATFLGAEC